MENIDIDIDIDKDNLKNINVYIDIDMAILENIDIDKGILQNIDIDKISYRLGFGISNTPISPAPLLARQKAHFQASVQFYCKNMSAFLEPLFFALVFVN